MKWRNELTAKKAAKYLGVSERAIYKMEKKGIIKSIRSTYGRKKFSINSLFVYLYNSQNHLASWKIINLKKGEFKVSENIEYYIDKELNKIIEINKIYHSDCIELMKLLPSNFVDLIFADPPYNLSNSNYNIKFSKSGGKDMSTNKGNWDIFKNIKEYENFTIKWLSECIRILKDNGSIWIAGTYHNIYIIGYYIQKLGLNILNEILWHKTDATPNISCTRFVADHENFIWARKGKKHKFNYELMKAINNNKQMRSLWSKGKTTGGAKIHPTQKPEWLLKRIILACTDKDDIVFDPFLGSGTTCVVAKQLGRRYLGCEINLEYFNLANERINSTFYIPSMFE